MRQARPAGSRPGPRLPGPDHAAGPTRRAARPPPPPPRKPACLAPAAPMPSRPAHPRTRPSPASAERPRCRGAPVRRGDNRVAAFQHDDGAAGGRGPLRPLQLAAAAVEQTGEFAFVRGHHRRSAAGRADRRKQRPRVIGEYGQRVSIEHGTLAGGKDRQRLSPSVSADPRPGPISAALRRRSASKASKAPGEPADCTMTPVNAAA